MPDESFAVTEECNQLYQAPTGFGVYQANNVAFTIFSENVAFSEYGFVSARSVDDVALGHIIYPKSLLHELVLLLIIMQSIFYCFSFSFSL